MIERIEAARGGPLVDDLPVVFHAEVHGELDGRSTLTVRVRAEDDAGPGQSRTLSAGDCEDLVQTFERIVSLVLGPRAPQDLEPEARAGDQERESHDARASTPTGTEKPEAAERERRTAEAAPAPRAAEESMRFAVLGVVDTASFGRTAIGAQVEGGWSPGRLVELRGFVGYVPPRVLAHSADAEVGGRFTLLLGGVMSCTAWENGPWRVPLCGGVEAGRMVASGSGVVGAKSDDVLWLAARTEVRVALRLAPSLRALASGGVVFPLRRHTFYVAGTLLHEVPAVAPRGGLGLELGF